MTITETAVRRPQLQEEVQRRRTFAIISHPDAGKTTLTEKLLLYGNAVEMAGSVRTRKNHRHARSDWMAMEQERGISITSTVLQFEYQDCCINLLDTPGHEDFSEDTYRTLMAVDSAIMVIDAAKGIEPQTRKLFEVCRMRRIPILTFVNKMDHLAREPLELLDEIENVLGIPAAAMNWPIGDGPTFQGVYDLQAGQVLRFSRTEHSQHKAPLTVSDLGDPALLSALGDAAHAQLVEDIDLLQGAGMPFDPELYGAGKLTPVYFGSALNNFGVEPFLQELIRLAPPPQPRAAEDGSPVIPANEEFSAFVFKIQANMNPKHRDSVAFARICSGRFAKDMLVKHPRHKKGLRLSRPYQVFAQERVSLEEAYPGDVIALANPGLFAIGDTIYTGNRVEFQPLPRFQPELFAAVRNQDTSKHKQFHKGLEQLVREGAIQRLYPADESNVPLLAAVGELQFQVLKARLRTEYNVEVELEFLSFTAAKRVLGRAEDIRQVKWPYRIMHAKDDDGTPVALFASQWDLRQCLERHAELDFRLEDLGFTVDPH